MSNTATLTESPATILLSLVKTAIEVVKPQNLLPNCLPANTNRHAIIVGHTRPLHRWHKVSNNTGRAN